MVGKINYNQVPANKYSELGSVLKDTWENTDTEPLSFDKMRAEITKPKLRRSFENYQQLKRDCESIEVWEELKAEILGSDLSFKVQ